VFASASAFNANIGAWNTAAVTTLCAVCAAPGPGGAHYGGRARPGFDPNIRIYMCIRVCVCMLHAYTFIFHLSVHVRVGRRYVCVHECAMGMDRLCAHALAGSCCGLGLKPETLKKCASPCPSASTASGFGAQAFQYASAFNADIGAWNTASVSSLASVCAAPGPAARTKAGRARPGFECSAAGCARRHRRCARACAHLSALACAGPWV
jgi:hypothetical protein